MKENVRHGTWLTVSSFGSSRCFWPCCSSGCLVSSSKTSRRFQGRPSRRSSTNTLTPSWSNRTSGFKRQIEELEQRIAGQAGQQQIVRDSSENLQRTIQQLLQLKKISVEKSVSFSDSDAKLLTASLNEFFDSQKTYQKINQTISDLTSEKGRLGSERSRVERKSPSSAAGDARV